MSGKLQYYTLRVFFVCLVSCAVLVLEIVWSGKPDEIPLIVPQLAMTLFVVGLAAFLIWLVAFLSDMRERIEKK